MARPLRYEAAGAVYHVMVRGDGGKTVFERDEDCHGWVTLVARASARFGWRIHAWVLMRNHFHLLLETPEANLVAGMKWLVGVYAQGWNRRRQRKGHVFQGRYKAVVVNGEEREGCYFKIVADYIHLNPVRSGWVGGATRKRLQSWRWSSYHAYAGTIRPPWLETNRVLRALQLSQDPQGGKAYVGYLEERAKNAKGTITDDALQELRRGWCLGGKTFTQSVLDALAEHATPKRRRGSVAGDGASAHDEAAAERIAMLALPALGAPTEAVQLLGKGRWVEQTALVAVLIHTHTGVKNQWIASRLGMGHQGNVTRAIRRVLHDPIRQIHLAQLDAMVGRLTAL